MRALLTMVPAVSLIGACMTAPMDRGTGQMNEAISSAEDETLRHADRCGAATSSAELDSELARHETTMSGTMHRIDGAMSTMHGMRCAGAGMASMMQTVSGMHAAIDAHHTRVAGADSVAAAREECTSYRDDMLAFCASARKDSGAMGCM